MITLEDCRGQCDADPELVGRLARQHPLPEILALADAQPVCRRESRTRRVI